MTNIQPGAAATNDGFRNSFYYVFAVFGFAVVAIPGLFTTFAFTWIVFFGRALMLSDPVTAILRMIFGITNSNSQGHFMEAAVAAAIGAIIGIFPSVVSKTCYGNDGSLSTFGRVCCLILFFGALLSLFGSIATNPNIPQADSFAANVPGGAATIGKLQYLANVSLGFQVGYVLVFLGLRPR